MRCFLLVLALASAALACTQPRSPRCREVCSRQAECRELAGQEVEPVFNEKECVAQCTALETDSETRHIVDQRVACFVRPDACAQCK